MARSKLPVFVLLFLVVCHPALRIARAAPTGTRLRSLPASPFVLGPHPNACRWALLTGDDEATASIASEISQALKALGLDASAVDAAGLASMASGAMTSASGAATILGQQAGFGFRTPLQDAADAAEAERVERLTRTAIGLGLSGAILLTIVGSLFIGSFSASAATLGPPDGPVIAGAPVAIPDGGMAGLMGSIRDQLSGAMRQANGVSELLDSMTKP